MYRQQIAWIKECEHAQIEICIGGIYQNDLAHDGTIGQNKVAMDLYTGREIVLA